MNGVASQGYFAGSTNNGCLRLPLIRALIQAMPFRYGGDEPTLNFCTSTDLALSRAYFDGETIKWPGHVRCEKSVCLKDVFGKTDTVHKGRNEG
jgi:hypothetical protein